MEKIIINYLNRNYRMKLSSPSSFLLYNKKTKDDISLRDVLLLLQKIFSTNEEIIYAAFEIWTDNEAISINNKIVELQDKIYLQTGKVFNLDVMEINAFLLKNDEVDIIF